MKPYKFSKHKEEAIKIEEQIVLLKLKLARLECQKKWWMSQHYYYPKILLKRKKRLEAT